MLYRHSTVDDEAYILDHLPSVELSDEEALGLVAKALYRLRRERPEGDRAEESYSDPFGTGLLYGLLADTGRGAEGGVSPEGSTGAVTSTCETKRVNGCISGGSDSQRSRRGNIGR